MWLEVSLGVGPPAFRLGGWLTHERISSALDVLVKDATECHSGTWIDRVLAIFSLGSHVREYKGLSSAPRLVDGAMLSGASLSTRVGSALFRLYYYSRKHWINSIRTHIATRKQRVVPRQVRMCVHSSHGSAG